jgi:hypothetical protein
MECQPINLPGWKVTLVPDLSIGKSFGELIPFDYKVNEDGSVMFTPQFEEVKQSDKEPEESKTDFPIEFEDDYDYMQ